MAWPGSAAISLALLVLVLARWGMSARGHSAGSTWGVTQMQPSELMKLALILALASWFHRASWKRIGNPLFLIPPAAGSG